MLVLELSLDLVLNVENDYLIKFLTNNEFKKFTFEEFTKLGNGANIDVDCYHRSNYPLSATNLLERMKFIRFEKKLVQNIKSDGGDNNN